MDSFESFVSRSRGPRLHSIVSQALEKKLNKDIEFLSKTERDDLMRGPEILDELTDHIEEG